MADVRVVVSAFVKPFEAGLNAATRAASRFGDWFKGLFSGVAGQLAAALSVAGVARFTRSLMEAGDAVDKGSKRIQIAAADYQKLAFAARRSGNTIENVETGVKKMNDTIDDARRGVQAAVDTFGRLGVKLEDLEGKGAYQQFLLLADALGAVKDNTERAALASDVFGRASLQLMPMLGDVRMLGDELERMGGVMRDDTVAAAALLSDQIEDLKTQLTATAANSGFVSWLTEVAGGIEAVTTRAERGAGALDLYLDGVAALGKRMPYTVIGLGGRLAQFVSDRRAASRMAQSDIGQPIAPDAVAAAAAKAKADAEARAARERERAALREKTLADMAARRDRETRAAAAGRLDEYLDGLREQVRLEELVAAGKERQASIEGALMRARKTAGDAGLTADQERAVADAAGRLYDLAQKAAPKTDLADYLAGLQEQVRLETLVADGKERQARVEEELARAREAAARAGQTLTAQQQAEVEASAGRLFDLTRRTTRDRNREEPLEVDALRRSGGGLPRFAAALRGADASALSVQRDSLRRLASIDATLTRIAARATAAAVWP